MPAARADSPMDQKSPPAAGAMKMTDRPTPMEAREANDHGPRSFHRRWSREHGTNEKMDEHGDMPMKMQDDNMQMASMPPQGGKAGVPPATGMGHM